VAERPRNRLEGRQPRRVGFLSQPPTSRWPRRQGNRLRTRDGADSLRDPARLTPAPIRDDESDRTRVLVPKRLAQAASARLRKQNQNPPLLVVQVVELDRLASQPVHVEFTVGERRERHWAGCGSLRQLL